jgi:hypothetical protein
MKPECPVRDGLIADKDSAFAASYEARNLYEALIAEGDNPRSSAARSVAENAERKAHNLQRALSAHYAKHGCNRER